MSRYAVVHVDDIPEQDDGRVPMRSVRHHLGITGFGVNAWTARNAGDRLIPEHQEANETEEESDRDEELYLGRAEVRETRSDQVVREDPVVEVTGERDQQEEQAPEPAPAGQLPDPADIEGVGEHVGATHSGEDSRVRRRRGGFAFRSPKTHAPNPLRSP